MSRSSWWRAAAVIGMTATALTVPGGVGPASAAATSPYVWSGTYDWVTHRDSSQDPNHTYSYDFHLQITTTGAGPELLKPAYNADPVGTATASESWTQYDDYAGCWTRQSYSASTVVGPQPATPEFPNIGLRVRLQHSDPIPTPTSYTLMSTGVRVTGTLRSSSGGYEGCPVDSNQQTVDDWNGALWWDGDPKPMPTNPTRLASSVTRLATDGSTTATWKVDLTQFPDADSDGVPDGWDNCPGVPNADQADSNENGAGDACENAGDATAVFDADWIGGSTEKFSGSASQPADSIATYSWDFGDGNGGDGRVVTHDYTKKGEYDVTLTVTSTRGDSNAITHRVAVDPPWTYGPEIRFHPDEKYFPMDTSTFVRRSSLKWAHDKGCPDDTVAARGQISPRKLGGGGYSRRQVRTLNLFCRPYGDRYTSDQYTRPGERAEDKAKDLASREGFYLDLADSSHPGVRPSSSGAGPRIYYTYRAGGGSKSGYVTYWFMYGFNKPPDFKGGTVDPHEGEWERISVRLDHNGASTKVAYYEHYCDPELSGTVYDWDQLQSMSAVTSATHPVVYSGQGGHASYPTTGTFHGTDFCRMPQSAAFFVKKFGNRFTDHVAQGPLAQKTWKNLGDIETQPWYGFGGAFGDTADSTSIDPKWSLIKQLFLYSNQTGPLGPPKKKPFSPW